MRAAFAIAAQMSPESRRELVEMFRGYVWLVVFVVVLALVSWWFDRNRGGDS